MIYRVALLEWIAYFAALLLLAAPIFVDVTGWLWLVSVIALFWISDVTSWSARGEVVK